MWSLLAGSKNQAAWEEALVRPLVAEASALREGRANEQNRLFCGFDHDFGEHSAEMVVFSCIFERMDNFH